MISPKLKTIFSLSIPLFIAHGLEEYFTGFTNVDSHVQFVLGYFNSLPTTQSTFLLFQIILWLILAVSSLLIWNEKWRMRLMIIPGLVYIYEFHHIWKSFGTGGYYPGVITALLFPIIAFFFWRELLKNFKTAIG